MSATQPSIAEAIRNLSQRLTAARSAVSVTAQALNNGETDLELQAAEVLLPAAETLDNILSELLSLPYGLEEQEGSAEAEGRDAP